MTKDGTPNEGTLCPICQQPFKKSGLKRHITVKHGKVTEIDSEPPISQSEPLPCETGVPEPAIGDEALRANQNPMDACCESGESGVTVGNNLPLHSIDQAKDIEDCDENSKWSEVVTGDGVEVGDKIDQVIDELYASKATKEAPIPNSPQKVLSQIPVNSEIMLNGEVYWQNPVSFDWELAHADKLQVVVVGLETVDNVVHLMCKVNGGTALWSVLQSDVLEGKYRIIKLAPTVPTSSPIAPPNGKREFVDKAAEELDNARKVFLPTLSGYLKAKEELEIAEKAFMEVHEICYQNIEDHVLQYGETVEDEGDTPYCVLEELGYRMRLVAGESMIFERISTEV